VKRMERGRRGDNIKWKGFATGAAFGAYAAHHSSLTTKREIFAIEKKRVGGGKKTAEI